MAIVVLATALLPLPSTLAAEELKLRDGISFYQDIDSGFPIVAQKLDDVEPAKGSPTLIFFGAAGDLYTNRQSRRVVDLYRRYRAAGVKFIVIDVDQPGVPAAKELVREYYRGYIPFEVILDKSGAKVWSQIGEVESKQLETQLDKTLDSK